MRKVMSNVANHRWNVRRLTMSDTSHIIDYWHDPDQQNDHGQRGADLAKIPSREEMRQRLAAMVDEDLQTAQDLCLVIDRDGEPAAYVIVKDINNASADHQVHCHIWHPRHRRQGIGSAVFLRVLQRIFDSCPIATLVFEPSIHNIPINKLIQRFGLRPIKTYRTQPSPMTKMMEVHRYEVTREVMRDLRLL